MKTIAEVYVEFGLSPSRQAQLRRLAKLDPLHKAKIDGQTVQVYSEGEVAKLLKAAGLKVVNQGGESYLVKIKKKLKGR